VFFDLHGFIYAHIVPRGAAINSTYTIKGLATFMEHLKKKRPPWLSSIGGSTGSTGTMRQSIGPPV
jgi:hypothetical protein